MASGTTSPSIACQDIGVQDRAHIPDPAAAPDLGPPPAVAADPGHSSRLLAADQIALDPAGTWQARSPAPT